MRPWLRRAWRFCTRPASREVWFVLDDVHALEPSVLIAAGIKGVLLDVDATLVPHHERRYPPAVFDLFARLQDAGLAVAIYSNARDIPALEPLGVPIVHGVPRKPDLAGFRAAVQALGMTEPGEVLMIGDNLISDGAAVDAGLKFAWCRPLPGAEPTAHRVIRAAAARLVFGRAAQA